MVDDTSEPPTPTQSIIRLNKPKARPEDSKLLFIETERGAARKVRKVLTLYLKEPSKPKKNTVHIKKESISDISLSITSSTTTTPVVESPKTTPTSTAVQSTPQSPTPPPSNLSTPSATAPPTVTPPTTTTITPASTVPAKRPAPAESSSSITVKVPKVPKTPKTPKTLKVSTTATAPSAKTDSPTVTVKPPRPVVTEPAEPVTKSHPHQSSTSASTAAPKHKHKSSDGVIDDIKKCKRIFNRINKQEAAFYFCHPVDEAADNAPNYYQIIK
jgi:hypothetical protein